MIGKTGSSIRARSALVGGAIAVVAIAGFGQAVAVSLDAGVDCWQTTAGSRATIPAINAGLLTCGTATNLMVASQTIDVEGRELPPGTCSCQDDVQMQWVDRHGTAVPAGSQHGVSQVPIPTSPNTDTCVRRPNQKTLLINPVPVEIEIIALSLQSVNPISVPMTSGPNMLCDVFISLNGPQQQGTVTFTPTVATGRVGTLSLSSLPVGAQFELECTGCSFGTPHPTGTETFQVNSGSYSIPVTGNPPAMGALGAGILTLMMLALGTYLLWRRQTGGHAAS